MYVIHIPTGTTLVRPDLATRRQGYLRHHTHWHLIEDSYVAHNPCRSIIDLMIFLRPHGTP